MSSNSNSKASNDTKKRLNGLSQMIQRVYLPLMESKTEQKLFMDKFVRQISISIQQAYGNVTIKVPNIPANIQAEDIQNDEALIKEFSSSIEDWTNTIKETIQKEKERKKEMNTATGETEYWRQRSATFNTLYQQLNMPQVKKILEIMKVNAQKNDGYSHQSYNDQYTEFQKQHAQAKDFVKFLTTLERQFKNIASGSLAVIEETLPSLLNGLQLIWTISRHINQNESKMEDLLEAISNEICERVKQEVNIGSIFKKDPEKAIHLIEQGIVVLEKWYKQFNDTRKQIEEETTVKRWEFQKSRDIFTQPLYMIKIMQDIKQACIVLKEFFAILGPDLKAVTGSSDAIDGVTEKVKDQVKKLEACVSDVFNPENSQQWRTMYQTFNQQIQTTEQETSQLINTTFKEKLNSSEGAFDLLSKFKDVKTRKSIEDKLHEKYEDVLIKYEKELAEMHELFEQGKKNPPISKNMPPKAGAIAWSRSIMGRIKTPIYKFKTKPEQLLSETGKGVAKKYVKLAKLLDETYETKIYQDWEKENTDKAIELLKEFILKKKTIGGVDTYFVNFAPELKVIIREAKFLDRIGKTIPQTITNIALQEKDYMRHVDKLNQLLRGYNSALSKLMPVTKKLLAKQIHKLNRWMDKGAENHNWFSLSISEYIIDCQKAIDEFKEIKGRVIQHAKNIEKQVMNIENAIIVRQVEFDRKDAMHITAFSEYFDVHRQKIVTDLIKDYHNIGDMYLKSIEDCTIKQADKQNEEMRPYYQYWERRIFNAITKMIIRALAANKTLWQRVEKPSLIRMNSFYNHPELLYHPTVEELRTKLEIFTRNILESTKQFGRWWDGFCKIFEERTHEETQDKYIPFTFYEDVMVNPVITQLHFEIVQARNQVVEKFTLFNRGWEKKQNLQQLFEKGEMAKLQKQIDKHQTTGMIEKHIVSFQKYILDMQRMSDYTRNYFVLIDYTEVKQKTIEKLHEWLDILGQSLREIALVAYRGIISDIAENEKALNEEVTGIENLKTLLKTITEVKNQSMEMEFRIVEVQEQFRVLKMYNYQVDPEIQIAVENLGQKWQDLLDFADKKDFDVIVLKQSYQEITKGDVKQCKKSIQEEYEKYISNGPGSDHVSLDEGLELMAASKEKIKAFNQEREKNVLAEKLFNLPISKYPELIKMEEQNKIYDEIYQIYKEQQNQTKEWSMQTMQKIDIQQVMGGAERFEKQVKKLKNKLHNAETIPPFQKLQTTITGFKLSLPLIQSLKDPAIQDRHLKKIMEETGKEFNDSISLKTITLQKVFELELQYHQEKVDEICKEAKEEARNENEIQEIDREWKNQNFEIVQYKKGNEVKGWALKSPDNIRELLEANQLTLQSLNASKYVRSIKSRVQQWEKDLNTINDVIDVWMVVQRKWMYLEAIFASDDIKMQLPEEARKFMKTDSNYKKVMEAAAKNQNVLSQCVKSDGGNRFNELKNISLELDKCQKSLTQYLESKRMSFPRFYFISDEDLLSILGSSDSKSIQPHLLKLFDNCAQLIYGKGDKQIIGMKSDEGEQYDFETPQKPEGAIEDWMNRIDDEMKKTLQVIVKTAVHSYAKSVRMDWIKKELGMVALVGTQIWWTFAVEDVFRRVNTTDKHAMKNELAKESSDLNDLIALIRTDLDNLTRKSVNTLIILDVHARDIVDSFVRDSVLSHKSFQWESQLRFYWDKSVDNVIIKQCTGTFDYCWEYQGLNGRLVITPLTDRCIMTITTALTFKLGGAPAGPAGTGKTETVKDLAKGLALRCVVTNCGETLDYRAMGIIFSGLIQTGFWGCFDEFNRINVEVLSVVSSQIKTVQNGLLYDKKKIDFLGLEMRLIPSIGIFITMNPGYAGRSELPDNLKALFRPVVMVTPDLMLICENMLMSEGFNTSKVLAKKMTVLYKLAKEQLSKQYHYDFGLRALKSVLVMAGQLKRQYSDLREDIVLMRALRDMNMPKFVFEDVPLFYGLIQDLFPGLKADRVGYEDLKEKIIQRLEQESYKHPDDEVFFEQVNKIVQLFETMGTRHTTMVVGPTGSGKSVIINTLAAALHEETGIPTRQDVINPKMITLNELYGVLDPESRDWTDGLLSKIFKEANSEQAKPMRRWILYDGDVDAVWVENMNSVMDDNRILTLANGDRIRLQKFCAMLFEVDDLQYASPATISRCGMVYVDPKNLGYAPFYERWLVGKLKQFSEMMYEALKELYLKYVPVCIDRIFEGITGGDEIVEKLEFITPRTNLNLVQQLADLIDSMIPDPEENPNFPQDVDGLEKLYIFCIIWSMGGCLQFYEREKFSEFVRQTSGSILTTSSLYDNFYDTEKQSFSSWDKDLPVFKPEPGQKFSEILVETVDTVRYGWLLRQIMSLKKPCMFVGDSGTAKTVTAFSVFAKLANAGKHQVLNVNFSSRTSSLDFQKIIEENIDKRTLKQYGPKAAGKKLVVFVDDLNMPVIDVYGTQQPNALLKFLVGRNQLYQRGGDLELRDIVDCQYVGCMTPPDGNNRVDPRVMTLYSCFNITKPNKDAQEKIYSQILGCHLQEFNEDVTGCTLKMTQATIKLINTISERLPRTPLKFHYMFNLRDMSRVFEGILLSTIDKFNGKDLIIRLWRHECSRVFADRLINQEDQDLVSKELIPSLLTEYFSGVEEFVMKDPCLFGDYSQANPTDEEAEDPRLYEEIGEYSTIRTKLDKMLEDYAFDHQPMNLVLFNDALEHVTKIHRIIRFPGGSGLLVGFGGSGKQSLTKLATFTAGSEIYTINLIRNYKEDNFKEDIRELYRMILKGPKTFLFTDAHVVQEGFLELLNNILTIGMVPALFPEEEKDGLIQPLDEEMRKANKPETKEYRWQYFVNRAREQIHIVMAMSPAGDTLRLRCRNFPGLVSSTNIDWFFPWPEDALKAVAQHFLVNVKLEEELREPITDHVVMIHQSVQDYSTQYKKIYKRNNFSTPKNYLDFISNYMKFLADNRKKINSNVQRLGGGLTTLQKAQEDTKVMSEELAIKNAEINEKRIIVEELIKDITEKSGIAEKQAAIAAQKKADLDVQTAKIDKEEAEAAVALEAAVPALEAAKGALANIRQADLTEIKQFQQPAVVIHQVCNAAYYLYPHGGNDDSWLNIKNKLLGDMQVLANLKNYDVAKTKKDQAERAKKKVAQIVKDSGGLQGHELSSMVASKNKATGGLFTWITATIQCYDIFKDVEPKRKLAEEMKKLKAKSQQELAQTEAQLKEVTEMLEGLNSKKKIKQDELDELQAKSNEMTRKLNAASKLINGLASEQERWTQDMQVLQEDIVKLVGDCLTGSAFLSYCGPFNFVLREKMIRDTWKVDLVDKNIPNKEDFTLSNFLSDDVTISRWASEGLPGDELSVQNGILTESASRWPLCIDPQMQAVVWIKEKEKKKSFDILSFNQSDYVKKLEMAIRFGKSILFEGIDEEIDPMIDPVLEKNIYKTAGVDMLKLADTEIEYNEDFRMFMTTKIQNPNYTPEVFGKTMIINFNVTLMGLRDQLLNEVVGYEKPDLEEARKNLILETSQNRASIKELEDVLLSELSKETDIPLVDNVPLIETLDNAKTKANEINIALEAAKVTTADIEANRESYKDVAKRGAILFFALQGLKSISEMYEYSLTSYMTVFLNSLETARKDNILQNRLRNIKEKLTQLVYEFTCMGIFESHKLMFSFQMTTMIMDGDDDLNKIELDFFLKGNTSLDAVSRKKPFEWMSDNGWKDATKLEELGADWQGMANIICDNGPIWRKWYDKEDPEMCEMPCGLSERLNKFQQLLVVRIFRPDRVVNAIKNFIIDKMGDFYIKSPPLNYNKIYAQSTSKTPIVFILSPGADPQSDVQKLVESTGLGMNKFKFQALGQGMGGVAHQLIEQGVMRGYWVMLQNCHLLTSWLKDLEAIIEEITKPGKADKGFRLWLTTAPSDKFPLGILQKSLKVVTEPPDGLSQNIKQIFSKLDDEQLNDAPQLEFKALVYVLGFFHSVLQERKKFGKIGWNVVYSFNESDFKISFRLISLYLNKAQEENDEELPWETLRYLIGEAMYGGRVQDNYDRRVLNTYLEEYMGDFIFDSNQKFFFSRQGRDYVIPIEETQELILQFIDQIPVFTFPGVYGLHSNAEIQYFTNAAKELWLGTIEMQVSDGASGGGVNREEFVETVANSIQEKIPEVYDIFNIRKQYDTPSPTQVVLLQELERFNILIKKMGSSISDLKRALVGEIGMSQQLDSIAQSFFNGQLPAQWTRFAPQTEKNLINWIEHFERRHKQYKAWVESGEPKVMWLSGLHVPESYVTALIQTCCRAKGWALDKSTMYTNVTKTYDPDTIKKRLDQGCYIQGLYIEGARWNVENDYLDYQIPKKLVEQMPLIQIIPVEANKLKLRGTIRTPVYVTQARRNAMGVGLVTEADLKTNKHVSHWVLQGVCLVLNTD